MNIVLKTPSGPRQVSEAENWRNRPVRKIRFYELTTEMANDINCFIEESIDCLSESRYLLLSATQHTEEIHWTQPTSSTDFCSEVHLKHWSSKNQSVPVICLLNYLSLLNFSFPSRYLDIFLRYFNILKWLEKPKQTVSTDFDCYLF